MKIIDAYILARTKRKTRRIRTALVTLVSSLLFAVLFLVAIVLAGVINGTDQVKDVGFNSRYLVSVFSIGKPGYDFQAVTSKIKAEMDAELRARKITVDENTRNDSSYVAEYNRRLMVQLTVINREEAKESEAKLGDYGTPSAVYHVESIGQSQTLTYQPDPAVDAKVKEILAQREGSQDTSGYDPFLALEFFGVEKDMLRTQLAPGQTFDWQPGQPVPLVITYPYLEKISGKSFAGTDSAIKNEGYEQLITQYGGKLLDYCWRNPTANTQLQDVVLYNERATKDTDKTTNPITIPVCGEFDQKQLKKLGIVTETADTGVKPLFPQPAAPAPQTIKMQFKIVGFVPGQSQFASGDLLTSIFTGVSTMPFAANPGMVPVEVASVHPLLSQKDPNGFYSPFLFVDFANRADQQEFLSHGCVGDECGNAIKPYLAPFGNIKVALEGVLDFIAKFVLWVVVATMAIAACMILFTISKVIADSTKEIAVFRAIGARRRDIAHIYFTYGGMLAVSSLLFAVLIAGGCAFAADIAFGQGFESGLVQAVGAYTQDVNVSLLGYQPVWLVGITGALLVSAAVGVAIPVIAATRRKLINILREE